ncbi:MAG TPA: hypothetical protein VJ385_04785 [Fibrobacteria bacterium]|nr:hypothetical protein [Fibrobacteria bacterium]
MPPYYDGKWLITSSGADFFAFASFNASGVVTQIESFPLTGLSTSVLDVELGPEGALYFASYDPGTIFKVEYRGTCLPVVSLAQGRGEARPAGRLLGPAASFIRFPPFSQSVVLTDLQGRRVWTGRRQAGEGERGVLPAPMRGKLYLADFH